jgi:anhydro-N-acetylmuramic acid kinase
MNKEKELFFLGVMSGTSLDGLDLALCSFLANPIGKGYQFKIHHTETLAYSVEMKTMLREAYSDSSTVLLEKHQQYGHWLGQRIRLFLKSNKLDCDYISSHGHTVFHRPELGYSFQLGAEQAIANETQIPVITDFRNTDIALGGQGAPLVPIGDALLFDQYKYCINIGGISNISIKLSKNKEENYEPHIIAYDIGIANMLLNDLAGKKGLEYDHNGAIAAKGKIDWTLYDQLNALGYYAAPFPKSLGLEWYEANMKPIFENNNASIEDQLHTAVRHIVHQMFRSIAPSIEKGDKILLSGGGAFNQFLVHCLSEKLQSLARIEIGNKEIIAFKEALIFAFMGYLKVQAKVNCYKSVTGAFKDSSCGIIFNPL